MMCGLFHNAIRATDLDTTRNFYTRLLDMVVDERRPPMEIPGFWLRTALPDSPPSMHVFGGKFAEIDGRVPVGTAAHHHTALYCSGYNVTRRRIAEYGLQWTGLAEPGQRMWIIFVYDPNGIMLELNFDAAGEGIPTPDVPPENRFSGGYFHAFDPAPYTVFAK